MPEKSRKEIVESCIEYFRCPQWRDVTQLIQERDLNHLHIWIDSCLHPYDSLAPLVRGYVAQRGWGAYRATMRLSARPGYATLYGFCMPDKAHFDMFQRFATDTILAPMVPEYGERGGNLRVWWDHDIKRFQAQFAWRPSLTKHEEQEVEEFFKSGKHWKKALDYVQDPDVTHVHCNIETSVHPLVLRKYAMEDLARRGWTLAHAIFSIFNGGGYDSGKLIFLGMKPERTYDIAYYHNPNVLIQPNTQETRMQGDPGTGNEFYLMRVSVLEQRELAKHKMITLTKDEIDTILKATKEFDHLSPYSWRFIPA